MAKYKKGDRVRISPDANSQFRGRTGIVETEPSEYAHTFGYLVKVESQGFAPTCQVLENEIEAASYN